MKRSFLTALGLEKDVIDQIMSEHGNTVELLKEKAKEDADKRTEKLNSKITELQGQVDAAPNGGDDYKAQYETVKEELKAYKQAVETEKATAAKQAVLRKQLTADGANSDLIDLLELKFDLSKIELDGDAIKDWDALSKPVKEQYAGVFGTTETKGAQVANPPASNGVSYAGKTIRDLMVEANNNPDKAEEILAHVGTMNTNKQTGGNNNG